MRWIKKVGLKIGIWLSKLEILPKKFFQKILPKIFFQSVAIFILMMIPLVPMVYWLTVPIPTKIQADLIVDRVAFRVDAPTKLRTIKFHSATLRDFELIRFSPTAITHQEAGILNTVQITGKEEQFLPTVIVETATPSTTHVGVLHNLTIATGAKVVLEIEEGEPAHETLAIEIQSAPKSPQTPLAILRHLGAFQVKTRHSQIAGVKLPPSFEVTGLSRRNPFIKITGQPEALRLMLSVPADKAFEIFPSGVSITAPAFIREEMVKGEMRVEPALVKEGEISYPAYPNIEPVSFGKSNFVFFGEEDDFKINQVLFDPDSKGIQVRLSGLVKTPVTTSPQAFPENKQDYRLTHSETIAQTSQFLKVMLDILVWLIPIIIGVVGIVTINVKILPSDQ